MSANYALILVVIIAVIALGAVAWFSRNWKVALAAAVVLAAGLAYQQIDKAAYQRAINEQKARELSILQSRIDTLSKQAAAYAERVANDEATIEALREQASATPANVAPCLPDDAAKRIGDIK
jgi:hypothetical protein